ncbi:MAG: lipid-A-disaccharide synthase [Bacteroidales bacterium]|nr:lipid-A-disaccharide synthase [Bacteroidales bacterium]
MKYYIIAGEASGDLHASNLMRGLKKADPAADFRFWGGDKMLAEGGVMVRHYKSLAYMGIGEVLAHLPDIFRNMSQCRKDILQYGPDVVILVDYPGFNLSMAAFAHKHGIPTYYYISPKVWAWKESRVKQIKRCVDRMFVIFPFEVGFYARHNYKVDFQGNPLIDAIDEVRRTLPDRAEFLSRNGLPDKPIVGLLAGSRVQEISRLLPEMLKVRRAFPDYQFLLAGAPAIDRELYDSILTPEDGVTLLSGQTYDILQHAEAALVTSGTATLETALFDVPQSVCYKTGRFSYAIGRLFFHDKFFSLVNIILGRPAVQEILQDRVAERMEADLHSLLEDPARRDRMHRDYAELREISGGSGASERVAGLMVKYLTEK